MGNPILCVTPLCHPSEGSDQNGVKNGDLEK